MNNFSSDWFYPRGTPRIVVTPPTNDGEQFYKVRLAIPVNSSSRPMNNLSRRETQRIVSFLMGKYPHVLRGMKSFDIVPSDPDYDFFVQDNPEAVDGYDTTVKVNFVTMVVYRLTREEALVLADYYHPSDEADKGEGCVRGIRFEYCSQSLNFDG